MAVKPKGLKSRGKASISRWDLATYCAGSFVSLRMITDERSKCKGYLHTMPCKEEEDLS